MMYQGVNVEGLEAYDVDISFLLFKRLATIACLE